tara:strand:+ start:982 stop:1182 length:201 start_codon:yes stop_codon:yes gene_type:complete
MDEIDRIPSCQKRSISWEIGVIGTGAGKKYRTKRENERYSISSTNPYAHIFLILLKPKAGCQKIPF